MAGKRDRDSTKVTDYCREPNNRSSAQSKDRMALMLSVGLQVGEHAEMLLDQ